MQQFELSGVGLVTIKKSNRARRLILKISPEGEPIVTIPSRMPYTLGIAFAKKHSGWFIKNLPAQRQLYFSDNIQIGQQHKMRFKVADVQKPRSRIAKDLIVVYYPPEASQSDPAVQNAAKLAAIRALKKQADEHLPSWFHALADENGYRYTSINVKKMKSRWGSCSSEGHISLSIWLMQLPDELIEYVLCHELVHLHHKHHQTSFWQELSKIIPNYKERRKLLRQYRPALML